MKKNLLILVVLGILGALVIGCPAADDDDDGEFTAGSFAFLTVGVSDACVDGALEVVYMPEGAATPSAWGYPIELPAFEDMPATVDIQLQDPFNDMTVEITSPGDDQFAINGEENLGVDLDPDTYDDCVVDYNIDALLTLSDNDNLTGTVSLHISNWAGDDCPASTDCDVTLDVEAARE